MKARSCGIAGHFVLVAAVVLHLSGSARAAVYEFDLDPLDYPVGTSLNDIPHWTTTDAFDGNGWMVTAKSPTWHQIEFGNELPDRVWGADDNQAVFEFSASENEAITGFDAYGIGVDTGYDKIGTNGNSSLYFYVSGNGTDWHSVLTVPPNTLGFRDINLDSGYLASAGVVDYIAFRISNSHPYVDNPDLGQDFIPGKIPVITRMTITTDLVPEPSLFLMMISGICLHRLRV